MTRINGMPLAESDLFRERFVRSLVPLVESSLSHVKATDPSSPWLKRLVSLVCRESYQLLPSGDQRGVKLPLNCGKGRSDWATVLLVRNPGYGGVENPRLIAAAEVNGPVRSARSAALLNGSSPKDASRALVRPFGLTRLGWVSHTPRLPT